MRKVFFIILIGLISFGQSSHIKAASLQEIKNNIYVYDTVLRDSSKGGILELVLKTVEEVKKEALLTKEVKKKKEKKNILKAVVSWYGKRFHGKKTASGETYNMNALTAAHKTLAFGTKVKFTNKRNGKSVVVTITDRGPFIKHRAFDLSKAAFSKVSDIDNGTAKLEYEIL